MELLNGGFVAGDDAHFFVSFATAWPLLLLELNYQLLILASYHCYSPFQLLIALSQLLHLLARPNFGLILSLQRLYPLQKALSILAFLLQLIFQLSI